MFITVEGINGSGRAAMADKISSEYELFLNKKVTRIDRDMNSFGTALDAVIAISDAAKATKEGDVVISTAYLDSMFSYYSLGLGLSLEQEFELLETVYDRWNLLLPDMTFHLSTSPKDARDKIMWLNSNDVSIVSNDDFCIKLDILNRSIQSRFSFLREKSYHRTIDIKGEDSPENKWNPVKRYISNLLNK